MKIDWRIKQDQWEEDGSFAATSALLREQRAVVDEACLIFDDGRCWHGWRPPAEIAAEAAVLARRIAALRADGIRSVGVNIWPAVGDSLPAHFDWLPPLPFQAVLGPDGRPTTSLAGCIRDPACRAHVAFRHRLAAKARPDFLWIDEYRGKECFCDHCLRAFDGGRWAREALATALDAPDSASLRRAWVGFIADGAVLYAQTVRATLDAVDPEIVLGLMTVNPDITARHGDYDRRIVETVRIGKLRPGHGWYSDHDGRGLVRKLAESGRTIARIGAGIADIQHEWEIWPGGTLDKGNQSTLVEITAALAAGNTGVAMNAGPSLGPVDAVMREQMQAMTGWRRGWERLVEACRDTHQAGLHLPLSDDILARLPPGKPSWAAAEGAVTKACAACDSWQLHGFPLCPTREHACGVLLNETMASSLTDEELQSLLSGFAVLDGGAAGVLAARGFSHLTGVRAGGWRGDAREFLSAHPLNGADAGLPRWAPFGDARALEPADPAVEVLGRLRRLDGLDLGASATLFRNALGGRVAVLGYEAWGLVGSPHRWRQLDALLAWGTQDDVPLRMDRVRRVVPWLRRSPDRTRCVLVLVNLGTDRTGPLPVRLACRCTGFVRLNGNGSTSPAAWVATEGGRGILEVGPDMAPWDFAVYVGN